MADDETTQPIPAMPEPQAGARDQRAATEQEAHIKYPVAPLTEVLIGRDRPASLAGMAAESDQIMFNRVSIVALNAAMGMVQKGKEEAVSELKAERQRANDFQARLAEAEKKVAVLATKVTAERDSSSLRFVVNSVGSVALGIAPYAFDKLGAGAAIVTGLLGAVLLVSAWLFRGAERASE
jgi:hypothetical protein